MNVRFARPSDLRTLVRLYRHRSELSWALYHPFPADLVRLPLILGWLILDRGFIPFLMRHWRRRFGVMVVAVMPGDTRPGAYGTVRFRRARGGPWEAQFGYLVRDDLQNRGIGAQLMEAMARAGLDLGVTRGVGTILARNAVNLHLTQRYGWTVRGLAPPDRWRPGEVNYEVVVDLAEILRRAASGQPTRPPVVSGATVPPA